MHYANDVEQARRELVEYLSSEYADLYEVIPNDDLRVVLSTLHKMIVDALKDMNLRLPTGLQTAHFWAHQSRLLLKAITTSESLERALSSSDLAFQIEEMHKKKFEFLKTFLQSSGGSTIPENTETNILYYKIPIFYLKDTIQHRKTKDTFTLKLLGEGSYAKVFKYHDANYNRDFVVKRAKHDLNEIELTRFRQEYECMSNLKSPYIVDVYAYDPVKKEYTMEFLDSTLHDHILKNANNISKQERFLICQQILKAFTYIHSKNILHRDISPRNILIKKYEDLTVVKISDFGLVKLPSSELTSLSTDIKGCFNDPYLSVIGFNNYSAPHETFALTRIIYFVLTGKTNPNNPHEIFSPFIEKGLNTDVRKRYQDLRQLNEAYQTLVQKIAGTTTA